MNSFEYVPVDSAGKLAFWYLQNHPELIKTDSPEGYADAFDDVYQSICRRLKKLHPQSSYS